MDETAQPTATEDARANVLRHYAEAHDRHASDEEMFRLLGLYPESEREHQAATVALRAWNREMRDPEPA